MISHWPWLQKGSDFSLALPVSKWLYKTGKDTLSHSKPVIELFQQRDFSDMAPNFKFDGLERRKHVISLHNTFT